MYRGKDSVKEGRSIEVNVYVRDTIVEGCGYSRRIQGINVEGQRRRYVVGAQGVQNSNLWRFPESGNRQHMGIAKSLPLLCTYTLRTANGVVPMSYRLSLAVMPSIRKFIVGP